MNQYLVRIFKQRKRTRCQGDSEWKLNGPIGVGYNLGTNNLLYFKGTCIYSNLDKHTEDDILEMPPNYLINKPVTIIVDDYSELVPKLKHPYWTPQLLSNGDYKIYRPPSYVIISIYKGKATPTYPKGSSKSKYPSELMFNINPYTQNVFHVEHHYSIPPWVNHIINNPVDKLNGLYYNWGSVPSF